MKKIATIFVLVLMSSTVFAAPKCVVTEYGSSKQMDPFGDLVLSKTEISLTQENDTLTDLNLKNYGMSAQANHYDNNIQVLISKNGKRVTKSFSRGGAELEIFIYADGQSTKYNPGEPEGGINISCSP